MRLQDEYKTLKKDIDNVRKEKDKEIKDIQCQKVALEEKHGRTKKRSIN